MVPPAARSKLAATRLDRPRAMHRRQRLVEGNIDLALEDLLELPR
jgi:hypothetical protein